MNYMIKTLYLQTKPLVMIGWIPKCGIASLKIMNIFKILILAKLHSREVSIHILNTVHDKNAFLSLLLSALISVSFNFFSNF